MRAIIGSSVRFRLLVVAVAAGIMAVGVLQLRDAPVDVLPEFTPPYVEVQTEALGLSAEEVEQLVTVPIEQSLAGIEGLETIRSKSVIQLSQVVLLFKPGTNELKARQLVAERLAQITPSLPTWAAPPVMLQPLSATSWGSCPRRRRSPRSSRTTSRGGVSVICCAPSSRGCECSRTASSRQTTTSSRLPGALGEAG